MFLRIVISCISMLIFTFTNVSAQIMHIHTGEEERAFNLADVDSIKYVDLQLSFSVEPEEINFGPVVINRLRNAILTITNTGNGDLVVDAIDIEDGVFAFDFENPVEIAPVQSHEFSVSFFPQETGDFSTDLIIHSNSQENPNFTLPISGSGYIPEGQVHFIWEQTDQNMSVLVLSVMINDESIVENDEVGVFTPDGLCAGGSIAREDFPERAMGIPAFGTQEGLDNGFQTGERLTFRIWDADAETEYATTYDVENDVEPLFEVNAFIVVRINAIVD